MSHLSKQPQVQHHPPSWRVRLSILVIVLLCAGLSAAQAPPTPDCTQHPSFGPVNWTDCTIDQDWVINNGPLSGVEFFDSILVGTSFSVDLTLAAFYDCDLQGSQWLANLTMAVFDACNLLGASGNPELNDTGFYGTTCPDGTESNDQGFMCSFESAPPPEPQADLAVEVTRVEAQKVSGPDGPVPGTSVEYSITYSNTGDADEYGVLASAMWPLSLLEAQTNCQAAEGASCTSQAESKVSGGLSQLVDLPANTSVTFSLTGTIDSAATGLFVVSAQVPLGQSDPDDQNNSSQLSEMLSPQADLSVTVDNGLESLTPGAELTYTIVATNDGPSDAPGSGIVSYSPLTFENVSWECETTGGAQCFAPNKAPAQQMLDEQMNLPAGSSVTYTVQGTLSAEAVGEFDVWARVNVDPDGNVSDPSEANDYFSDQDPVAGSTADLLVSIKRLIEEPDEKASELGGVVPGTRVTYSVYAANDGPDDSPENAITISWPQTLSNVEWTCESFEGANCSEVPNKAFGGFPETVGLPAASWVVYTLSGDVDPSATGELQMQASLYFGGGENKFVPEGSLTDPDLENNVFQLADPLTPTADLGVKIKRVIEEEFKKTVPEEGDGGVIPGTRVTYSISAYNEGPSNSPDNQVSISWPEDLMNVEWVCEAFDDATCPEDNFKTSQVFPEDVNLPGQSSVVYTLSGDVNPSATGEFQINASVFAGEVHLNTKFEPLPGVFDPDPENNSTSLIEPLTPQADLAVTIDYLSGDPEKTIEDPESEGIVPGTEVTYRITARNNGLSDAPQVYVSSLWNDHLIDAEWHCESEGEAECPEAPDKAMADLEDLVGLPAESSLVFTLTAFVDPDATGTLEVTAGVSFESGSDGKVVEAIPISDPNEENNSASSTNLLTPQANLALELSDEVDSAFPGDEVEVTALVENLGPSSSTGGEVVVMLDEGLALVSSADGCSAPGSKASADVACDFQALAVEGWVELSFVVQVSEEAADASYLLVNGSSHGNEEDPESEDDSDELSILVDTDYPTVLAIETADGTLAECDNVTGPTSNIDVIFSETVAGQEPKRRLLKTNVVDFFLVTPGNDGIFDTSSCEAGLGGDDTSVSVDEIDWKAGGTVADLDFLYVLDDGLYRFFVCASGSLEDNAGKGLDGNGDGEPGDDLMIGFRVDRDNLLANGHLDCGMEAWTIDTPENSEWAEDVDRDELQDSGASRLNASHSNGLGQCVAHGFSLAKLEGSVFFMDFHTRPRISLECEHFSDSNCQTPTGDINRHSVDVAHGQAETWIDVSLSVSAPDGAGSSYCSIGLGGSAFLANIDSLTLQSADKEIFIGGFESGDLNNWLSTVE